ncbi:WH1-domain-containing protein [Anaeromyces robustus]|uniref:WH1-domain-containing protein n=1 Tax=Anaeromyces robustus TaxID=1754192 RepID=A0A1Y1XLZ2_9FUNG|nr:WH1-domain-containing protein [Anaeromyces robustus]|eukprot:ORX86768.1 WH1-domain-containing protein [Anaeromyces robustus]
MATAVSSFNANEKQLIESSLRKFQIMRNAVAVARLYVAFPDRNNWTYKSLGAITVVYDNVNSYFLKLLDIQRNGEILWEYPISKQLKYKEEKSFFHSFYTDNFAAGLSFADENEAKSFLTCVIQCMNQVQTPRSTKTSSIISGPTTVIPTSESNKDGKKKKKSKDKDKSKSKKNKGTIDRSMISGPTNFRQVFHMGSENLGNFTEEENKIIQEAFNKIMSNQNITKEELMNAKNLEIITAFFSNNKNSTGAATNVTADKRSSTISKNKGPAPAPPTRRAPPPPPTSRGGVGTRAPPPPPPSRAANSAPSRAAPAPPSRGAPPVPSRAAPPPLPSREAPAPPVPSAIPPLPSRSAPAPPVPSSGGGPPPPPPPPGPIQAYRTENTSAPPPPKPVVSDASESCMSDLLASIRNAGVSSLRPASERQIKQIEAPVESNVTDDLVSALAMALLKRKDDMNDQESDESSSEDDDSTDSEWTD